LKFFQIILDNQMLKGFRGFCVLKKRLKTFLWIFIDIFSLLMGTIGVNLVKLINWVPLEINLNA